MRIRSLRCPRSYEVSSGATSSALEGVQGSQASLSDCESSLLFSLIAETDLLDSRRRDLRSLAPEVFTVDVRIDSSSVPLHHVEYSKFETDFRFLSPTTSTVFAAADALRENKKLRDAFVSREEYLEVGSHATRRKFGRLYMSDLAVQDAIHNA